MRRSPLSRRTPLKVKRDNPRRNDGRVQHGRMKRKATDMNELEETHIARIKAMRCLVSGRTPVEVHHLMKAPGKRCRRDHRFAVPLHHLMHRGPEGIHGLGSEELFETYHKLAPGFLIAWAQREWEITNAIDVAR